MKVWNYQEPGEGPCIYRTKPDHTDFVTEHEVDADLLKRYEEMSEDLVGEEAELFLVTKNEKLSILTLDEIPEDLRDDLFAFYSAEDGSGTEWWYHERYSVDFED